MKTVYVTKAYGFCAGHRLFDPRNSADWNERVFGKCSLPGGHGHNYRLEVTVRGTPDPETGQVIALDELDRAVEAEVMERIDHQNLNDILTRDYGPAPTTEVLALEIWRAIEPRISGPAKLHAIGISETPKNSFLYRGEARSS